MTLFIHSLHFSEQLDNLLLQNQRYLNRLDSPTTSLNTWKNTLSVIRYEIEPLNITSIDLTFSLTYFPNLKSLLIFSSFGFPEEHLKSVLESNQFKHLQSLKIKENQASYSSLFGFSPHHIIYWKMSLGRIIHCKHFHVHQY